MAWKYYREKRTGDFVLARDRSRRPKRLNLIDVAGPADDGDLSSIGMDMATEDFLRLDCEPVLEQDVPEDWRRALRKAVNG